MTKSALQREAQQADLARQDFLRMREGVKATEVAIPFVFYDGTNVPGGLCRVKKSDHIWLFLDKARKVGAELGVGGDNSRRNWARVSVDDLMLVRGDVILPHVRLNLKSHMYRLS
jgi:protein FAM50